MKNKLKLFLFPFLMLVLSGCDLGWRTLGAAEYGLKFRILPPFLGGGLSQTIYHPGQLILVWPWESLYRFDTKIRTLEWGAQGAANNRLGEDYVLTRALDGNEVSLAVKIEYRLATAPSELLDLIQNVGTSDAEVEKIVISAARADIRTSMNKLKTSEFFNNESKYRGESEVKEALQKRLGRFGVEVVSVNLKEHRFERVLPDGSTDLSYQEKINEVQKKEQDTKREELRIATVTADKQREFNDNKAQFNRIIAEAEGVKKQSVLKADGYYKTKANEAEAILARGKAEAEGLNQQISALSGQGGLEILKMEIAEQLQSTGSKFVVLESQDSAQQLRVNKIDSNELIEQLGLIEAMTNKSASNIKKDITK